jgi:hypothetical protein
MRLREALAEAVTAGWQTAARPKEALMVEVTVEDVIVGSPKAEPAVWMAEPKASPPRYWRVVFLKERAGRGVAEGAR